MRIWVDVSPIQRGQPKQKIFGRRLFHRLKHTNNHDSVCPACTYHAYGLDLLCAGSSPQPNGFAAHVPNLVSNSVQFTLLENFQISLMDFHPNIISTLTHLIIWSKNEKKNQISSKKTKTKSCIFLHKILIQNNGFNLFLWIYGFCFILHFEIIKNQSD